MSDDARVEELLARLLESGGTPEEICRTCPELIERVREGWQELRTSRRRSATGFRQRQWRTMPILAFADQTRRLRDNYRMSGAMRSRACWAGAALASSTGCGTCASIVPWP